MVEAFQKFRALSRAERSLLLQALFLLPVNAVALRLMALKQWQRVLTRLIGASSSTNSAALADTIARMVDLASRRGVFPVNCLHRSLALWWILKRHALPGELRIGVRRINQTFEAHAWVESLGIVLNDSPDVGERFAPFTGPILRTDGDLS